MSYFFDGTDGIVLSTGSAQVVVNYPFSIFAWVFPLRTTNDETIIGLRTSSTGDFWRVTLNGTASDQVQAISFKGGGASFTATTTTAFVANKWQFVGARFDSNTSRVAYLGTDSANNTTDSTQTGQTSIDTLYIGTDASGSRIFRGFIANVAIRFGYSTSTANFNNETDILSSGASQFAIRPENLILHWSMTNPGLLINEAPQGAKIILPYDGISGFSPNNPPVSTLGMRRFRKPYLAYVNKIPVLYRQRQMQGMAS